VHAEGLMSQNVVEITDANFETEILTSPTPAVIDFWAPWCAPCRAIAPTVEQLAGEFKGQIKFGKLNIEALAMELDGVAFEQTLHPD